MKTLFFAITAIVLFARCKKDSGNAQGPVITLVSPTNHQQFTAGQTVSIIGNVSEDDGLHEVHLHVRNKSTGADLLNIEEHPDTKSLDISKTFTVQASVTYSIELEATDHSGNETKIEIEVRGV
jgi:hypothetical protein